MSILLSSFLPLFHTLFSSTAFCLHQDQEQQQLFQKKVYLNHSSKVDFIDIATGGNDSVNQRVPSHPQAAVVGQEQHRLTDSD